MRLPNGYGTVYKLSGKRRKPYIARKTIGWDEDGKQKYYNIGYYKTKTEALQALADYNTNPYDINSTKSTFIEIYQKWSEQHFTKISQSNIVGVKSAIKICETIYNRSFIELKLSDYQYIFDKSGKNAPTLKKLKTVLKLMYEFAIKYELIPTNKLSIITSIEINADNPNKLTHIPFTHNEINILWKHSSDKNIQMALMLIYGGYRISEFCGIKKENVNIEKQYVYITDSKTINGIRTVPIADKVLPFYKQYMEMNDYKYLITNTRGNQIYYDNFYRIYWNPMIDCLKAEGIQSHRVHDTRHTAITLLTEAKVDERFIAKIIGHSQKSLAQKVYSHVDNELLLNEINKI